MSLSVEERRDNIDFALKLLLENIGNRAIGAFHIVSNAPEYSGIYPTTWHELVNKNYLQQIPGFPGRCTFTGFGLRSALELCGMQEPLKEMLGRMCKHLKDSISRNRGTSVS